MVIQQEEWIFWGNCLDALEAAVFSVSLCDAKGAPAAVGVGEEFGPITELSERLAVAVA